MDKQEARVKLLGEYMEELGICTRTQLEKALGYAADCARWGRYIPVGQALMELGYATQDEIDAVLMVQTQDQAAESKYANEDMPTPPVVSANGWSTSCLRTNNQESAPPLRKASCN